MRPDDEEELLSEYQRFSKNSRGVPGDFQDWIQDLYGDAIRKPNKKQMRKLKPEQQ